MNSPLDFTYIPTLMKSSSGVSLILFLVISYLTLPFYVYVHILRREREKNFPIVQLLYKIVKLSYVVLIIFISMMVCIAWNSEIFGPESSLIEIPVSFFLFIILFVILYPLHFLQQTFHLLLFSTAIMNSLKYFFPYNLLFSHNYLLMYVKGLIIFFISKDFILVIIYFRHSIKHVDLLRQISSNFYMVLFLFVNIAICLITPFTYIPIMIDMRKNSHRYSQQHFYLLKYLFVQSLLVSLMKMITLPFCSTIFDFTSPLSFMFSMTIGDAVTTPLIIQLSYLNCNLKELFSLYTSFTLRKILNVFFGKMDNSVHPNLPPHAFSIT